MRDLVVREAVETMARDAAKRFRELVAAGEEIPYEVIEPGAGSSLCRYEPQTERFVRDHAPALRELDSFGTACAALESAALAEPYLETLGISAPEQPRARAELAAVAFLCRLWMDSSDFSLDSERLEAAIFELEAGGEPPADEVEVAVQLRGFQMPVGRLVVGEVTIVRADTVAVPAEARTADGLGASPWEPTYLAVIRCPAPDPQAPEPAADAVAAFRRLITALRLYKAGGVALGPHAWIRAGGDRWRRIATGAGRPRPGGYRLAETELADFAAYARMIADPRLPLGDDGRTRAGLPVALGRAVSRFEAGLERLSPVEGLNDHLLALRFLLEGGGPAQLGLAIRVAALCAEPAEREAVKAVVDSALAIERELWSGEPAPGADGATPAAIALELEGLTRAILKDTAAGHLGSDLRVTADEILLADGLRAGDGSDPQRGATAEWSPEDAETLAADERGKQPVDELGVGEPPVEFEEQLAPVECDDQPAGEFGDQRADALEDRPGDELDMRPADQAELEAAPAGGLGEQFAEQPEEPLAEELERIEQGSEAAWRTELRVPADPEPEEEQMTLRAVSEAAVPPAGAGEQGQPDRSPGAPERHESPVLRLIAQTNAERDRHRERVANLFPRPETTEWNVREIAYDRRRRAEV